MKFAMADLSKGDRGDEADTINLTELLYGRYFRSKHFNFFLVPPAVLFLH